MSPYVMPTLYVENGVAYLLSRLLQLSLSLSQKFGALNMATRGTVGTEIAMLRFTRLSNSKVVPKWRQPLSFSGDFNNVLLVAFASQLVELVNSAYVWNTNLEAKNPLVRGTAIAFYTLAEVSSLISLRHPNISMLGYTTVLIQWLFVT